MEVAIREAENKDIKAIYNYMYQLAMYEDLMDYFTLTQSELETMICVRQTLCALVVEKEGRIIGCATYYFNRFTQESGKRIMYLEDIYIENGERNKGYGYAIFENLRLRAKKHNCKKIEWKCLSWNEPAIAFYKKIGACHDQTWLSFQLNKNIF